MLFYKGRIYIKDFLAELKDHDIEIPQAEVKKIMEFSDREGQVGGGREYRDNKLSQTANISS